MASTLKRISALLLTAVMLISGAFSASAKKISQSDINNMNSQIAGTQAEINRLNGNRNEIRDKQKEIAEQLKEIEKETAKVEELKLLLDLQIEYLTEEILTTEKIVMQCQNDIALKTAMIESTKQELEEKEALFIEFFRNNYEQGSTKLKYIEILLTSRSISDFILNVQYIGSILDYEQYLLDSTENLIATYKSQVSDLEKMQALNSENIASLDEKKQTVDTLSAEAGDYILQLMKDEEKALALEEQMEKAESDLLDEIQALVDKKNNQVATKEELEKQYEEQKRAEEELRKQQEEEKRREEEEKKKQEQQQGGSSSGSSSSSSSSSSSGIVKDGEWQWPINYNLGKWTSPFGWRPDPFGSGKMKYHNGVDLALAGGNNIYAVDDGTVLISKRHNSFGNYVVILHDNGYKTLYAHASKLLVSVGDRVAQGKIIAKVGTTGDSTGNHLHFSVINPKGDYVNPADFFPTLFSKLKRYF